MSSPTSSPATRPARVARTYGRAVPLDQLPANVFGSFRPRTGTHIGARGDATDESDRDSAPYLLPATLRSNWRAKLLEMDSEDDDELPAPKSKPFTPLAGTTSGGVPNVPEMSRPAESNSKHASSPQSSPNNANTFDFSINTNTGTSPDTSPSASPLDLPSAKDVKPFRSVERHTEHPVSDVEAPHTSEVVKKTKPPKVRSATQQPVKPKRLTKKEQSEMARETARMLSDQRVTLSRGTRDTRLSLSDLTAKLSSKRQTQNGTPARESEQSHGAPSSPIDMFSSSSAIDELAAAAAPNFLRNSRRPIIKPQALNVFLHKRSAAQAVKSRQEKKEDWIRRGGRLKPSDSEPADSGAPVDLEEVYSESVDPSTALEEADAESIAGVSQPDEDVGLGSGEDDFHPPTSTYTEEDDNMSGDTEEENVSVRPRLGRLKRRTAGVVADSDSEPERERERVLVYGSSFHVPGVDSASESEKDKENCESRKFDTGDEKENRALHIDSIMIPRGSPFTSDKENEDKENARTVLKEQPPPASRLERRHTFDAGPSRHVLGELASEERQILPVFALESPGRQRKPPAELDVSGGLTQLFEDDEVPRGRSTLPRSLSEHVPRRLFDGTAHDNTQQTLQFTPTQNRRNGHSISSTQLQRDQEIMAMDIEDVSTQPDIAKQPEWFIADNGLMTQTRPAFTPIVPTPLNGPFKSLLAPSPFEGNNVETPSRDHVLRRLKRKDEPPPHNTMSSPTNLVHSAKRKRNAFDVLHDGAKKRSKEAHTTRVPAEYVQDQADESDDENGLGFGGVRHDDEEIDEEAMKAAVEGMMDDQEMDMDTLNADLVLEKHQEQLEIEDQALQELHEKAARGDLRKKKGRGGLNLDDDSSDDEGFRRPRPVKHARNIENDSLPQLAVNPKTKAFYDAYQSATFDDEQIVAQEVDLSVPDEENASDDEGGAFDNENQESAPRVITATDLRRELLAAAKKPSVAIDPDDIDWVTAELNNSDDEANLFDIEEIPRKLVQTIGEPLDRDLVRRRSAIGSVAQLQLWAKQESSNKRTSARRGATTSAVTGHAPARAIASNTPDIQKMKGMSQRSSISQLAKFLQKKKQS